ncbi:MAG: ABC transporter substrate-binding protein [Sulfurimonas sp.]
MRYLLLILLLTLSVHSEQTKQLEKVSLQLHWKYQFEFAGFIAAKEKGFYKDVGLDVELKEYQEGIDIEDDVLEGISTYGIYNSSTLLDSLRGKPLKLVASFFKRAALVLIVKPEIKSPKGLAGKTIMASTKEDFELNFEPFLDVYGIDADEIILKKHTYNTDDFSDPQIDGMTAFVSDQVYKLDQKGIKYNILDPSNDNLYVLQMELFTSENELREHPTRVNEFRNASIKGWKYALSHKEEIVELIHKKYAPQISKDELIHEAHTIERLILPMTYDIGSIDRNFLHKQMQFFKKRYGINTTKTLSDYVFNYEYIDKQLYFTEDENDYIKQHPVIDVCIHHEAFPIDGINDQKMTGIMSDIFNDISHISSLSFQPVPSSSVEELKSNVKDQKCQLLSAYATNSKKFPTLEPSAPFMRIHFTLISNLDKPFILSADQLKGKTITVEKEAYKKYLLTYYPALDIVVAKNKHQMVRMLNNSKVYAVAALDFQADYLIDKYGYGKLKINGFLAKEHPVPISIGVQKDQPLLFTIVEKSLQQISSNRIENILSSWRISRYQKTVDYSLFWEVFLVMVIVFAVMIVYQRKLRSFNKKLEEQVLQQTKILRAHNESLEESVEEKVQELTKKDELLTSQSKQAVMGEMISMIAHQWRQPLNTMTLQISNIQLKYLMNDQPSKEEILKTFEAINTTILYLSETVDDFKTYFCKGKEPEVIDLEELINKSINLLRPRLKEVELNIDIYHSIKIMTFENELMQVLLNILNNTVDAYEECTNCKRTLRISLQQHKEVVYITVEDNAGGIPAEHLDKLFEPYFSTKGKNGTGLGLYMSQMIVEKHFGGSIDVQSGDGKSIFTIKLPITCPVSPEKAPRGY